MNTTDRMLKRHMFFFHTFEAIWRDRRLPDWWKQPVCSGHLQVKSWGRTGESALTHTWSISTTVTSPCMKIHIIIQFQKCTHCLSSLHMFTYFRCVNWPFRACYFSIQKAAVYGARFKNQTLTLAWHKAAMNLSAADADEGDQEKDEVCRPSSCCYSFSEKNTVVS